MKTFDQGPASNDPENQADNDIHCTAQSINSKINFSKTHLLTEEEKIAFLKRALEEGIESGVEENFDKDEFLQELKRMKPGRNQ
ncbi:MAG: type II toxin-antitoxin system ParD family antitoxin [Bacteroidia bacterium]|jgi:hypothetical protein|nr:type II toxin-antitoxin system ParD family antitoxin [Bacteroidia bacterium]